MSPLSVSVSPVSRPPSEPSDPARSEPPAKRQALERQRPAAVSAPRQPAAPEHEAGVKCVKSGVKYGGTWLFYVVLKDKISCESHIIATCEMEIKSDTTLQSPYFEVVSSSRVFAVFLQEWEHVRSERARPQARRHCTGSMFPPVAQQDRSIYDSEKQ